MTRQQWNGPWCAECDTGVDAAGYGHMLTCSRRKARTQHPVDAQPVAWVSAQQKFHVALVLEMSELCDRNSPEDEPDAMVANSNEMAGCIERALERSDLLLVPPTASTTGSAPEIKPIGYVTQYALTHVLAHGGNIPMHPEPLSLANVPVYLTASASPAASVLTDALIFNLAMEECVAGDKQGRLIFTREAILTLARDIERALVASMGGDRT